MAPSEMTVPAERLDKEFFDLAEAEGVTDIDELNRVLDRAVGLRTFLTADDRVEKVAAFVAEHFKENVLPLGYKAFLVGVDREACAKYKRALDKLLPPEWSEAVYTENAADVDRPAARRRAADFAKSARTDVAPTVQEGRREPEDPDRHRQAADRLRRAGALLHVPRQADARPRAAPGDRAREPALCRREGVQKRVGLVVDFVGVLRELKKALQFDSADVSGVIEDLDVCMKDFLEKIEKPPKPTISTPARAAARTSGSSAWSTAGSSTRSRARRSSRPTRRSKALWEILSPSPELRDHIRTTSGWPALCGGAQRLCRQGRLRRRSCLQDAAPRRGERDQEGLGRLPRP